MIDETVSVTLYPKRYTAILLLLGCGVFTAVGIGIGLKEGWMGYLIASFPALGIMVSIIQLIPGSAYLHLDSEGFTFCSLFRKTTIAWSDVDEFFVITLTQTGQKVSEMVGFNFEPHMTKANYLEWSPNSSASAKQRCPIPMERRQKSLQH